MEKTLGSKESSHGPLDVLNRHQECNGVERHNTSYIWGCYHIITNHTIYVHIGTTSTVYFICKFRKKTGSTPGDTILY